METKNNWRGWLYLLPALALLSVFTFYPLISTFLIAFKENYNYMTNEFTGWGFDNFVQIFNHQRFLTTVFFLPYVTNTIAIGMVFAVMFNSKNGLVNEILRIFGLNPVNWLGGGGAYREDFQPSQLNSMIVLLTYIVWNSIPFKILILLSGLQGIDKQYYQAAQIDATPRWRVFMRITVPLLSPQIAYLLITSFIGAFKEYTSVVAIFGEAAGPIGRQYTMTTIVWYIYSRMKATPVVNGMGWAAAGAVVLFFIIMLFTMVNLYVSKKRVHY
jgi:multiple sugar transport system permease protein